jgi:hypothetical protein
MQSRVDIARYGVTARLARRHVKELTARKLHEQSKRAHRESKIRRLKVDKYQYRNGRE